MSHYINLTCGWLQDNLHLSQSEAIDIRSMLYYGILKVFVSKEGQQSNRKWNVAPKNNKTTDKIHREKSQRGIKKDFM